MTVTIDSGNRRIDHISPLATSADAFLSRFTSRPRVRPGGEGWRLQYKRRPKTLFAACGITANTRSKGRPPHLVSYELAAEHESGDYVIQTRYACASATFEVVEVLEDLPTEFCLRCYNRLLAVDKAAALVWLHEVNEHRTRVAYKKRFVEQRRARRDDSDLVA